MLTGSQIRAARAMLSWSATELAQRAQISMPTVQRAEAVWNLPSMKTTSMQAIKRALETGGIVFLPETEAHGPGVALERRPGTDFY